MPEEITSAETASGMDEEVERGMSKVGRVRM
jgi:hypothetical protein